MKKKRISTFNYVISLFVFLILQDAAVNAADLHKTFSWKYPVNKDANVIFQNYDCDLVIHTWDKAETEYRLTIHAKTRSDDDSDRMENFLENLEFDHSSSSVTFKSRFWKNRVSIMGRTTMSLAGEKNIVLSEFDMKAELWIPQTCLFDLTSKYSRIEIEDIYGNLSLDLYNDNLYGKNVDGRLELKDKYSKIEFNDLKDVVANLYESDLEAANMGNLKVDSKYSKVISAIVGTLEINGYSDKYSFTSTNDVTFNAKYSDLVTESSDNVKIDSYEGTVKIEDLKDIEITSKYTGFEFGNAGNCKVYSSYNDKMVAVKMFSLEITESKYCSYEIAELISSVKEETGYEDNFVIEKTGSWFTGFSVNGKYIDVSLGLPGSLDYRLMAKIKYPDLKIDESALTTRIKILENSQLEYDGVKGKESDGMPVIEVNGYEVSLKILYF